MNKSIATIKSPEFINLNPLELNPLMSSCEIKVLYIGENRNHTYIDKDTAIKMSKTLRGAPIVGYYKEDKEDFADHGEQVIIDDEGVKFKTLTKPYGFVAPDAKVWFQIFSDEDEFGNQIEREYLMTTGYLWTGQFPEAALAVQEGRPQSMELDKENFEGKWAENLKSGIEFFIINDAIFSKLCILGEDVEPCFEGASVTAPNVSTEFTKIDNDFKNTLYSMMQDLKNFALLKGGNMDEQNEVLTEIEVTEPAPEETPLDPVVPDPVDPASETFAKKEEEEGKDKDKDEEQPEEEAKKEEDDEEKKKYSLLEQKYNELNENFTQLQDIEEKYNNLLAEYTVLKQFKEQVDNNEKDKLIESFYMLSDEDKADVIEHKTEYSLEDIESKLSVICVRKKVNFASDTNPNVTTTYTFNNVGVSADAPAWIKACENTQKNRK